MLPPNIKRLNNYRFFHYVQSIRYIEKPIMIGGDLNTYLNPELDKCGGIREVQSESSKAIEDFCSQRKGNILGVIKGDLL